MRVIVTKVGDFKVQAQTPILVGVIVIKVGDFKLVIKISESVTNWSRNTDPTSQVDSIVPPCLFTIIAFFTVPIIIPL